MSAEKKEKRLIAEINNGRLAQLGIFGFLCADAIPGSVPALNDIATAYSGNPMVPFEGQFSYFHF
jgi:Chlorophyll A-B binding protein